MVSVAISCYMLESRLHTSRKRQRSEPNETTQPAPKRQSLHHPRATESEAAFYDSLSKVWLTKRALRELDRRNTEVISHSRPVQRQARRPITRSITRSKENHRITKGRARSHHYSDTGIPKAIRLFAKHGGPDLSHLRNYPTNTPPTQTMSFRRLRAPRERGSAVSSSSLASDPTTNPTTYTPNTKSTGPYDRDFQQNLVDAGVFPPGYRRPGGGLVSKPDDEDVLRDVFARYRASLSPSKFTEEEFEKFVQADADAPKEKQVSEAVLTAIEGSIPDHRCRGGGIRFTNLSSLTGGNLKSGNPDIYYGARPEQLKRQVRDELGEYIIPSTQHDLPIVPNFVVAAKGPEGSAAVAKRQACYDGAQGARAMHSLQSYKNDQPEYGGTAAVSSTYHDGTLKLFAHHLTVPSTSDGRPEYHMTQQRSFALTDTLSSCREGIKAYRNAREWTAEQRDEAIKQANERATADPAAASLAPSSSFVSTATSGLASRFASDASTYTIEPLSQPSEPLTHEDSQTTGAFDESETSTEEAPLEHSSRGKRPSRRPKPTASTRRKRHNADGPSVEPSTSHVLDSAAATAHQQGQWWAWANDRFECYHGSDILKHQDETPADKWVYLAQGWPGQAGKKWKLWKSATQECSYS